MKDFIKKIQDNPIKQGIKQDYIEDLPVKGCNCGKIEIIEPVKPKRKSKTKSK